MQASAATTPPAMLHAEMTPAVTLATTPAATLATAAQPLVWMSLSDWLKVVTRRELKAEQKVERPKLLALTMTIRAKPCGGLSAGRKPLSAQL